MCSILGSFSKPQIKDLYQLNSYRGELSYSVSTFRPAGDKINFRALFQSPGAMPDTLVDSMITEEGDYIVAHSQAPTTDTSNIHPAVYGDALLWHNGIIKQKEISEGTWDTLWLLEQILDYGWGSLSNIDGTFACVMYKNSNLYVFRNEISPLFVNDEFAISSTQFDGSTSLAPNTVWRMNFETKELEPEAYFTTKENPYYIPE